MTTILKAENKIYTYEDYVNLKEGAPYQLIGGDLIMTPAPSTYHQRLSKRIGYLLYEFVEKEKNIGEVFYSPIDVLFSDTEVFQPDIIYISYKNSYLIGANKIEGAPDLIIEIISPSSVYYDLNHKKSIYEKHGVKEYWVVDPMNKTVKIFENKDGQFHLYYQATKNEPAISKLVDGFKIGLENLF